MSFSYANIGINQEWQALIEYVQFILLAPSLFSFKGSPYNPLQRGNTLLTIIIARRKPCFFYTYLAERRDICAKQTKRCSNS